MKEIGGYFEWENRKGSEYHAGLYRFDAIRSALHFIILKRGYSRIWIPRYLCGCIPELLTHIGLPYSYYSLQKNFLPSKRVPVQQDECLFFVNYYGQFSNDDLLCISRQYPHIFVDNTHSFFQFPVENIDTGYTCRKYFGVPDGAYLSTAAKMEDYDQLSFDCSYMRMGYILGRYEVDASTFYKEYTANDSMPRGVPILKMSRLVQSILQGLDYPVIIKRRKENFLYLHAGLACKNELPVKNNAGLFLYPFLHKNGCAIKKNLILRKIYVPTLWPEVLRTCPKDSWEYYLASNLVLLPIDHRYSQEDMQYILDTLFNLI